MWYFLLHKTNNLLIVKGNSCIEHLSNIGCVWLSKQCDEHRLQCSTKGFSRLLIP